MKVSACRWPSFLAALLLSACPGDRPVGVMAPPLDLSALEAVDLTHPFDEETVYWPTAPSRFELTVLAHGETPGGYFYSANAISTPEHGGTHLDAPLHFAAGGWSAAEIPVARLIGPAVLLDVYQQAAEDPDYALGREVVESWEAAHGPVPAGAIVLLRTGWGRFWPDASSYLGSDEPGDASDLHFPSYGLEAVRYLVQERGVAALGVDTASIDPGDSADFPVHRLAAAANVAGLENLANLERVPEAGAWVVALPMKIAGGSGGPLRAVALVPE